MQIPKIFHNHSQYYVHYKSYKGRKEARESVWEREIKIEPRARTKHNISKFPNSQNPKAEIETQTNYPALKNSIHKRERERERERETEIEPSQCAFHKHGAATITLKLSG